MRGVFFKLVGQAEKHNSKWNYRKLHPPTLESSLSCSHKNMARHDAVRNTLRWYSGLDETSYFFADHDGLQVKHGHLFDGVRLESDGNVSLDRKSVV